MTVIGTTQSADSAAAIAGDPTPGGSDRGVQLLIVDDHADTVRGMQLLLTRAGYKVRTALDAKSALEAIAEERFDVVISDLGLGDMHGCDLMRKVREQCSSAGIAISGYSRPADARKSHDAGFSEYLVKPLDFAEFLNVVARVVDLQKQTTMRS